MADITMCNNKDCPKKKDCYRYMAIAENFQCYADFVFENKKCDYFYPLQLGMKTDKKKLHFEHNYED